MQKQSNRKIAEIEAQIEKLKKKAIALKKGQRLTCSSCKKSSALKLWSFAPNKSHQHDGYRAERILNQAIGFRKEKSPGTVAGALE